MLLFFVCPYTHYRRVNYERNHLASPFSLFQQNSVSKAVLMRRPQYKQRPDCKDNPLWKQVAWAGPVLSEQKFLHFAGAYHYYFF